MRDPPKPFGSVSCTFYSYSVPTKKEKQPLSVTHPELAKEADGWDPETVSSGSGKKLSWKCSKKHSWDASVTNRALLGSGCPYCTRKIVIKGENDLASEHPELIDECDGWDPSEFFSGSNLKMPWVNISISFLRDYLNELPSAPILKLLLLLKPTIGIQKK